MGQDAGRDAPDALILPPFPLVVKGPAQAAAMSQPFTISLDAEYFQTPDPLRTGAAGGADPTPAGG